MIDDGNTFGESRCSGPPSATGRPGSRFTPVVEDPSRPYILALALGRVVEKKGFDLLLSAYGALGEDQRTADLVIAGEGMARPDLGGPTG